MIEKKFLFIIVCILTLCMKHNSVALEGNMSEIVHLTSNDSVRYLVNHPAFQGFAQSLLPLDDNTAYYDTPLQDVRSLLPYHSHVNPDIVVGALNHMIEEVSGGKTVFYDFYTEQQKQEDPGKAYTGLFFDRGRPGAPFAIVCPGGGFSYVGSLHEGFPLSLEISQKGYNAFVIGYRIGSQQQATEDLAAAVSYIFEHADMLEVSTDNYALWGASAGAKMVGDIALQGVAGFGGSDLPKPSTVVIAYTGHTSFSEQYPPTFIMVSEDDWIVNAAVVDRRVENLRSAGIDVEYHKYRQAGHGFGVGVGTDAEGWMDDAVRFWENFMPQHGCAHE